MVSFGLPDLAICRSHICVNHRPLAYTKTHEVVAHVSVWAVLTSVMHMDVVVRHIARVLSLWSL